MIKKYLSAFFTLAVLLITSCSSTTDQIYNKNKQILPNDHLPSDDFIIDEVEEFTFDENKDSSQSDSEESTVMKGAAFKITISSQSYSINQFKYYSLIRPVRSGSREAVIRNYLSRYNRKDLIKTAHVLISLYPSSGRLRQYRIIKSTYIRELDTVIMKDLSGLKFKPVRSKIPSVIYITYVVRLHDFN